MNILESEEERQWKLAVKEFVTTPELKKLLSDNSYLRFIEISSLISSVSGFFAFNSLEHSQKTPMIILSGALFSLGISSGVTLFKKRKITKKLKLERKQEYKRIINETKNLSIEEKQKVLVKKYNIN